MPFIAADPAMKVKLKNVFVIYFLVSVIGLMYALMQLGEWQGQERGNGGDNDTPVSVWLGKPRALLTGASHIRWELTYRV